MYKLQNDPISSLPCSVTRLTDGASIPFDSANSDYQKFKVDLNDGVELQDQDGNVMSAEQVSAFLETLP